MKLQFAYILNPPVDFEDGRLIHDVPAERRLKLYRNTAMEYSIENFRV